MQSLRYLYKIGNGPSSSHTMGPALASKIMLNRYPTANNFKVVLYGSLALTGKGHLTDKIIIDTFAPKKVEVLFDSMKALDYHPNTLDIYAYKDDLLLGNNRFYSIGGGSIEIEGEGKYIEEEIYPTTTFSDTKLYIKEHNISLVDYIRAVEGDDIISFVDNIYTKMEEAIYKGLNAEGVLPGKLQVVRKAKAIYEKPVRDLASNFSRKVLAYAFAVAEENASGGIIVTAPTCGSCGVLPSVLYAYEKEYNEKRSRILDALLVAGFIGNLAKNNASISGAEAGCQAEIGVACAMTAGAYAFLLGCDIDEIEQAAEIALEHHLGLTCDPVDGYVQIPCIERNAICALRAIDSANLVQFVKEGTNMINFDMVCNTMLETGKDINQKYRETAKGGLAKLFRG